MKRQNLDRQWTFKPASSCKTWEEGKNVDLPHDYTICQKRNPNALSDADGGYFPIGVALYEKTLFVPDEWKGKKIVLEFEGVYMNATVTFNRNIVAKHPYGYTSFHCNLTPYIFYGEENLIEVEVNNSAPNNTRWYSGSGINRHVWLLIGGTIHISPWGIYASTPKVSGEKSTISIKTKIENCGADERSVTVRSTLLRGDGSEAVRGETVLEIPAGTTAEAGLELFVLDARLWSPGDPYLYTLKNEVVNGAEVLDSVETMIGIRSISVDAENGFRLNGVSMKLKGGCVHHDCGPLGASAYDRAEERKVELHKANGFNAIRCAHNPPSPTFLDACDRLGILVIDEAFDAWRHRRRPNDYSIFFDDWWERDLASMICRDRNHPSIIMWSIGNEIPESDGRSEGAATAAKLADFVRSLDNTRPVTDAICVDIVPEFIKPLDVVGYNYHMERYEGDGQKFPGRVICGTETFPKDIFDGWGEVERLQHVIGDFVWTSLDYLGESGIGSVDCGMNGMPYPWHQAFCGDMDICGFKRPQSYYRDCVWGISKAPYIAVYKPGHHGNRKILPSFSWSWADVAPCWTWPGHDGKPVAVDIYSADDEVELFLNGKTLGRKSAGKTNRYLALFDIVYAPGELAAVGYKNGSEVSRSALRTAGSPASLRLAPDRDTIKAEFGDLSYVTVEVLDIGGNIVPDTNKEILFSVTGVGALLAVGSGNPKTEEMYTGNIRSAYEGRALAIVQASGEPGVITLTAAADGIPAASAVISCG